MEFRYKFKDERHEMTVLVYVVDFAIPISEPTEVKCAKVEVKTLFKLTGLTEVKYFMGVFFKPVRNTMLLSQLAYSSSILEKLRMERAKTKSNPTVEKIKDLFLEPKQNEA